MAANIANRRKTYIKQPGLMRKSPKRFCILTKVLIGVEVFSPSPRMEWAAPIVFLQLRLSTSTTPTTITYNYNSSPPSTTPTTITYNYTSPLQLQLPTTTTTIPRIPVICESRLDTHRSVRGRDATVGSPSRCRILSRFALEARSTA